MSLFAFSIHESFHPDNPWARRLTGGGAGRKKNNRAKVLLAGTAVLYGMIWLGCGATYWLSGNRDWLSLGAGLSVCIIICAAATGPFTGANSRGLWDHSPLLHDSLLTKLTARDALAAVHGNILQWTLFALEHAVILFFISQIAILFWWVDYTPRSAPFPVMLLALSAAGSMNYVAGFYFRASLAATTRLRQWPVGIGCLLALGLVPLSLYLRWVWIGGLELNPSGSLVYQSVSVYPKLLRPWALLGAEAAWIALRLALARLCWARAARNAEKRMQTLRGEIQNQKQVPGVFG